MAKLIASDAAAGDRFGVNIAVSGDTAVVGSYFDDHPGGTDAGSAYVFVRSAGVWTQQTKLTASDAAAGDNFGNGVTVSGDTVVVGARGDDHSGLASAGSAYVFVRSGGVWTQQAKLTASDPGSLDEFGIRVAVSGDTAVVGSYLDNHAGGTDAGSAYVFVRSAGVWTQQTKLTASDAAAGDRFGTMLAVSGDTAVVGSYLDDHAGGTDAGSAYVFGRSGGAWTQQAKLTASDTAAGDHFGIPVALSGDTLVVGASFDDHSGLVDAGSAYVFVLSGGVWTQQAKLTAPDAAGGDEFGLAVALSGDTVVVGSHLDDHAGGTDAGSAYFFGRSGGVWTQQAKFTASDAAAGDQIGWSAAISGDTALVGAYLDDHAGGADAGSAYVFSLNCDRPPVADAGLDQSIHAGDTVFLDGGDSFDDNTPSAELAYAWSLVSLPQGSAASLTDSDAVMTSFTTDLAGSYVVQLVVSDSLGQPSLPSQVEISSTNLAPTADAGMDQAAIVGSLVTLSGAASTDPEMDDLTYQWTLVQFPAGSSTVIDGDQNVTSTFEPDLAGEYVLELVVDDGLGSSEADTVLVTIISGLDFAQTTVAAVVVVLPQMEWNPPGHQRSFSNLLSNALKHLQPDKLDLNKASQMLNMAIVRADGCALRGTPDGAGPEQDWLTDCGPIGAGIYDLLVAARDAISP